MAESTFASRSYRDEGVVLRTHKLGEADRIITLLTKEHGQVRAVARGVRRMSSRFGARLEPFMVADLQLVPGRSLEVITQAQGKWSYGHEIASDYSRYTVAVAMTETAEKLTDADADSCTPQYSLLVGALNAVSRSLHAPGLILDSYLLRALATAGWAPSFDACARCDAPGPHSAFSAVLGGMVCSDCRPPGAMAPAPETVELLAALLAGNWMVADASTERARSEASGIVANFLQWHLERRIKSLPLVDRSAD